MATKSSKSKVELLRCREVLILAVSTRVFLFALMLLWRMLGRHYDTSALLNPPCLLSSSAEYVAPLFPKLSEMLEKFIVWDGVYYIRIAECGYEYEQTFAFLPVFPLCIRLISITALSGLIPFVGYRATLCLSAFLLNIAAFVLSALFFYRVSFTVLKDDMLAYLSTALFCLNPASIFYASIYSESLFSLLTFTGLLEFLRGSRWRSACLFAISGGVRSNGVVHGGFLFFHGLQESFKAIRQRQLKMAVRIICSAVLQTAVVLGPFVAFQVFGFMKLCWKEKEGTYDRPWCNNTLPYLYGFVQSNYWDVGFLRYFQLKQLPNFLLASPMLSLAVGSIVYYIRHRPKLFFTLGLCLNSAESASILYEDKQLKSKMVFEDSNLKRRRRKYDNTVSLYSAERVVLSNATNSGPGGAFFSPLNVPFLMEMGFMALVACFVMHVQVATRFLSICPPIYWFAAHIILTLSKGTIFAYLIWGVFMFYVLLGSLLFVNFYPFT